MHHGGLIGGIHMREGKGPESYEAQPKEPKLQSGSRAGPNHGTQATANSLHTASAQRLVASNHRHAQYSHATV
jgi:hypothetical protein